MHRDWRGQIFYSISHFQDSSHDIILRKKSAATWWFDPKRLLAPIQQRPSFLLVIYYYRALHYGAKRCIAITCGPSVCPSVCLSIPL